MPLTPETPGSDAAHAARAQHLLRRERLIGIALMCVALLFFAGIDTSAKWLNHTLHPLQTVWARYAISVLIVSLFINPWSVPGVARTARPWLQIGRSLLLLAATALNFAALIYLQLAETTSIMFASPLLVALIAGPLLGEWIGPRRLAAIGVGFLGVLVITRPGIGGMHPAALLSVGACFVNAMYSITTRMLAKHDRPETTLFYSGLAGLVIVTPLVPFVWTWPADALTWFVMLLMGACGAIGHWLWILAHARAPASILAPFTYSQIIIMVTLGYLVFHDVPDRWTIAGAAIVVASGLYLLYRERVVKGEVTSAT